MTPAPAMAPRLAASSPEQEAPVGNDGGFSYGRIFGPIARRGLNVVELDQLATSSSAPYGIITADCSSPKEIDDGIFVEPLPTQQETYRVGVCVVDTSKLYENGDIFKQAMDRTEARYWQLPDKETGYDPMIDEKAIKNLEFSEGNVRNALIISFIVGKNMPPGEVDISFGKVEVTKNLDYRQFWVSSRPEKPDARFGRASALIIGHLGYTSGGDYDDNIYDAVEPGSFGSVYSNLFYEPGEDVKVWLKGSKMNEAFMVAANYLVGQVMAEEGRPAIYRVHDPNDATYQEILPTDVARYSSAPGRHFGLNLEPYCRVTSPLRRLEDFVMNYQLKQRYLGRAATLKDSKDIAQAVRKLNQRVVKTASEASTRLGKQSAARTKDTQQLIVFPGSKEQAATA